MSDSSSASSSRSASPSLPPKQKSKKGKKRSEEDGPRNEGEDLTWAYQPPEGTEALENPTTLGDFDWDTFEKNEDLDLWLIRVPDTVCFHDSMLLEMSRPSLDPS